MMKKGIDKIKSEFIKSKSKIKSSDYCDAMMTNAYRAGQLSKKEWQDWLDAKAFCEKYK
jgi:hypothetical protein